VTQEQADTGTGSDDRFVKFLTTLWERQDRGALAHLRRSLGREDAPDATAMRLVVPFLPLEQWKQRWYYLVGGLFALHPTSGAGGSMGDTFRMLGDTPSSEKRFVSLLNSRSDDLPYRLRQAVSLARAKDVGINWGKLLHDLLRWEHEARFIQAQWARAYWGNTDSVGEQAVTAESAAATGKEVENDR